jgi:hypothetical protein
MNHKAASRRDLGGSLARPHAVVGIFIVNNRPETMAGRFYNRRFASRSSPWTGALTPGRGRDMCARSKKPGAVSRPGGWRSFDEYAFLEDSRYMSQEGCGKICILRVLRRAKA